MTITLNTKAYNADAATSPNSIPYVGPSQTLSVQDNLLLARTPPKPLKTFSGVGRSRVKFARTLTLTGALTPTGLATIDANINVPVGAAGADVDSMLADAAAAFGQQWVKDLAKNLDITA
jgi:hypothetical protein